jgi:hypothetical protein
VIPYDELLGDSAVPPKIGNAAKEDLWRGFDAPGAKNDGLAGVESARAAAL